MERDGNVYLEENGKISWVDKISLDKILLTINDSRNMFNAIK